MANYQTSKYKNTKFGGADGIEIPKGGTADRAGTELGQLRYNTDLGFMEQYNATGWAGIDAPPTVSNVTGTINEDTDSTITITGSNFKSGSTVAITGPGVNNIDRALSTTFVSSTELTAATNASSVSYVGGASFNVKVTNPSGLSAVIEPAGTIDRDPAWTTSAGSLGTFYDSEVLGAKTYRYTSGSDTYQVIEFKNPSTYTWTAPITGTVDVLVVGGGGAGGGNLAGAGGAGGVIQTTASVSSGSNYNITVGRGGHPISSQQTGQSGTAENDGAASIAFGNTANGGGSGGGGSSSVAARTGGSGGGASGYGSSSGASGTAGQGNAGGSGAGGSPPYGGGGGGGAGGAGSSGSGSGGGAGGPGVTSGITGTTLYYGGGGGGGAYTSGAGGNGGAGGGGGGGSNVDGNGGAGDTQGLNPALNGKDYNQHSGNYRGYGGQTGGDGGANTGGGGGGASHQEGASGAGGSGVVIVRYNTNLGNGPNVITLNASDPDGGSVSFALASGTLPSGTSLSANGIDGYLSSVGSSTVYPFTVNATSNGQSESRAFSATVSPIPSRILVAALTDAGSSTVASPSLVSWTNISESSTGGIILVDKNSYPFWGNWTHAVFTSKNRPGVQWRFRRDPRIERVVTSFMRPYSDWNVSSGNGNDVVQLAPGSTNFADLPDYMQFQHNNGGSEKMDIPTLGRTGDNVWSSGMHWGQIDSPSNYGGILNTPYGHSGSGGSATGDTLFVYLENSGEIISSDYTNYLTPSGPLGDARNFTWTRNSSSGIGGAPGNVADAVDRNTSTDWPNYGHQQQGNDVYIQVDLGSGNATAFDYTFVIGYPGGSHMSNQNLIQGSNDNSNWTTVCEWSYHPGAYTTDGGYLFYNQHDTARYIYSSVLSEPTRWIPMNQNNDRTAYRYYRLRGTNFNSSNGYQLVMNWALLKKN